MSESKGDGETAGFDFKATVKLRLGDGTELVVHSSALADVPFFKAMSSFHTHASAVNESNNNQWDGEVELPFDHVAANIVLRYVYSARLVDVEAAMKKFRSELNVAIVQDVLEAVHFLGLVSVIYY